MRGKFIVIYGANNLGKSTQVEMLIKSLEEKNIPVKKVKYPIYDLEPTGPQINAVLRQGKQISEEKLQKLYAQNRKDFQPELEKLLEGGTWVISEDYSGTGIAWGIVRGLKMEDLEKINKNLLKEDIAILLYGERFKTGIEINHRNENNGQIWQKAQSAHLLLAKKYDWKKVYANQDQYLVNQAIMEFLMPFLPTK